MRRVPLLQLLAFGVAYVVAAKVGFRAAFTAEQVSAVWPPTGLAVWAILYFGWRGWPAIWLAAFIANVTTHVPWLAASGIATGNTLEALLAGWLLHRFFGVDRTLDSLRQVTGFVIAAAVVSTIVSATIGVTTLCVAGLQPWARFGLLWSIWWLGDATGALLIAPVLLTGSWLWRRDGIAGRPGEAAALEIAAVAIPMIVFVVPLVPQAGRHPLEFAVFPLVIWAGLRFAHFGRCGGERHDLGDCRVGHAAGRGTVHDGLLLTGRERDPAADLHGGDRHQRSGARRRDRRSQSIRPSPRGRPYADRRLG
jgi:integral membrane sensor domain MASE1